jgi:hypothetical protein
MLKIEAQKVTMSAMSAMVAHYDTAGAGLDRFQPIVTPVGYPGENYDRDSGVPLNQAHKDGFLDRFWDRGDSPHTLYTNTLARCEGLLLMLPDSGNRGASLPQTSSSIQSPIYPRCMHPRLESQVGKRNPIPHIFVIDATYINCCCPNFQMPSETQIAGHQFLRRHLSLWGNRQSLPDLDIVYEDTTSVAGIPWKKSIRAPVAVPFEAKNMPAGGEPIDLSKGHAGNEELYVVEGGWAHR